MPNSQAISAHRIVSSANNQGTQSIADHYQDAQIIVISAVAIVVLFAVIALLVSKLRRTPSTDSTDGNIEMQEMEPQEDPYLQAIMFPSEPEPVWHKSVRTFLRSTSQTLLRKPQEPEHRYSIPEDLRHQLKHIYVY